MSTCFEFWLRSNSGCGGALVLAAHDLVPGARWGLLDSDGTEKLPLTALRRCWAAASAILADEGLSRLRMDAHNDGAAPLPVLLELTTHGSVTRYNPQLTGRFSDLCHAYRLGPAVATAAQVRLMSFDGGELAREVLVLTPARGPSSLTALAEPDGAGWLLTISSRIALRAVCIVIPGFRPSDACFHLAAGLACRVRLEPDDPGSGAQPTGTVTSIDSIEVAAVAGHRVFDAPE